MYPHQIEGIYDITFTKMQNRSQVWAVRNARQSKFIENFHIVSDDYSRNTNVSLYFYSAGESITSNQHVVALPLFPISSS